MPDFVIRYYGLVGPAVHPADVPEGAYLRYFDAEAAGGQGIARWTVRLADALRFHSASQALEVYNRQPHAMPTRPDGRPNRPLAAFTVSIEPLPEPSTLTGEGSFSGTIEP